MKTIIERLKSPVVQLQIISIICGLIVVLIPQITNEVKAVLGSIIAVYNIFAGMNDPTNKEGF